jgi:hypothetical protein
MSRASGERRGMERIKTIALARTIVGASVCVIVLLGWTGAALASPPAVTLSGHGVNEFTGEFYDEATTVTATLSHGVASGSLSTEGHQGRNLGGGDRHFTGNVTCMVVHGNQVTVGAFGTVLDEPEYGPASELPGTYSQLLTVEFGEFAVGQFNPSNFLPDSFGALGAHKEGVPSATSPNCQHASFEHQFLPYGDFSTGAIYLSPSITSPGDGYVSRNGTVTLSGTGEPNRLLKVYEVGDEAGAKEVTANANDEWSVTLTGLSAGKHVFTASAVKGSTVPANTVEIDVPPPPNEWTIFPSPNPGSGQDSLSGISCVSARHCMAVGAFGDEALAEALNRDAWSVVPTPVNPYYEVSSLRGVSCVRATFCVAVGEQFTECHCAHRGTYTLAEVWNGTEWSIVPSPNNSKAHNRLVDASCVSTRFCVAVGWNVENHSIGLVESWNGSAWSIVPTPESASELHGVSCVSARFCVAVGGYESGGSLVESWSGKEWSIVPSPGGGALNGVSCLSAKHCVAVGGSASGTLVDAWNGSTWSGVESPNPEGGGHANLTGVSCASAGTCAAVGSNAIEEGPSQTLVETSKGGKWSIAPSENGAGGVNDLNGVSCASTESCFAVGEDETAPEGPLQALVEAGGIQPLGGFGFRFG